MSTMTTRPETSDTRVPRLPWAGSGYGPMPALLLILTAVNRPRAHTTRDARTARHVGKILIKSGRRRVRSPMIAKTFFLAKIIHRIGTSNFRDKKSFLENMSQYWVFAAKGMSRRRQAAAVRRLPADVSRVPPTGSDHPRRPAVSARKYAQNAGIRADGQLSQEPLLRQGRM